jgi:hypothetical protein
MRASSGKPMGYQRGCRTTHANVTHTWLAGLERQAVIEYMRE